MLARLHALATLTIAEAGVCNPPATELAEDADGTLFRSIPADESWADWGYIRRPTTRRGWFVQHLVHGLLMRYPWWKVVLYAVLNTDPEGDP